MIPGWAAVSANYFISGYDSWPKVYFIGTSLSAPIKIGKAVNVAHRLSSLQTGSPDKLTVFVSAPEGPFISESSLHDYLSDYNVRGEWFHPEPEVLGVMDMIRDGKRHELAEKIRGSEIDLDWMATCVYAGIKSLKEGCDYQVEAQLPDKELEKVIEVKLRMPL